MVDSATLEAREAEKARKKAKQLEKMRQYAADRQARNEENATAYIKWKQSDAYADGRGGSDIDVNAARKYIGELQQRMSGDQPNAPGATGGAPPSGPMGSIEGGIVGGMISGLSMGMLDGSSTVAALNAYAVSQAEQSATTQSELDPHSFSEFSSGDNDGGGSNIGSALGEAGTSGHGASSY